MVRTLHTLLHGEHFDCGDGRKRFRPKIGAENVEAKNRKVAKKKKVVPPSCTPFFRNRLPDLENYAVSRIFKPL
jgi:hypothetical protein